MRLIDADKLKEAIEQGEGFSWDSHGKDDLCVRKKYIDNAPTIEERPQGKWILCEDTYFSKCSICGDIWLNEECWNYCSNCGAEMKGGAE